MALVLGYSFRVAMSVLLAGLVLECGSRLVHLNARPMIPSARGDDGTVKMVPNIAMNVRLPGQSVVKLFTDSSGARVADVENLLPPPTVLVVGDSQALGWGLEFSQTFASKIAARLFGDNRGARILAAAATDPESIRPWARILTSRQRTPYRLRIISVNLGNDLDEMVLGRGSISRPALGKVVEWLGTNSILFLDVTLLRFRLFGEPWGIPPGTNPVLFFLKKAEYETMVWAVAEAIVKLSRDLPDGDETIIVLIPNDTQVDPREIEKYATLYPSASSFEGWRGRANDSAQRLRLIEEKLNEQLTQRGFVVVEPLFGMQHAPAEKLFYRTSHHLTDEGHSLVADSIINQLKRD
jgi:hypothetical protein